MVEVFKYTNRVVNMVRPRKLLFMAIGACTTIFIYVPRSRSSTFQTVWLLVQR